MAQTPPLEEIPTQIAKAMWGISSTSPIFPILGNSRFTPGYQEEPFKHLLHSGYEQASHFLIQGKWLSLQDLMDPEGPLRLKFWIALQLSPPPKQF